MFLNTVISRSRVFLLFVALVSSLYAQTTGKISGFVTNEVGKPISLAFVSIDGTTMGGVCDSTGYFFILGVRAGKYKISGRHISYLDEKKEVSVQVGVTTEINFNLKKKIYKLETLTITPKE